MGARRALAGAGADGDHQGDKVQDQAEGGLANRDAAACELGMGAMAAGTSVRRRPLMDRRTLATSHISQGDHGTSQLMSPPRAHVVRVKALCQSARSDSYGCILPRAPTTGG